MIWILRKCVCLFSGMSIPVFKLLWWQASTLLKCQWGTYLNSFSMTLTFTSVWIWIISLLETTKLKKKKDHKNITIHCLSPVAGPKEWKGVYQAEVGLGQFLRWWARHLHQLQQERQTQPVLAVSALASVTLLTNKHVTAARKIQVEFLVVMFVVSLFSEEVYTERENLLQSDIHKTWNNKTRQCIEESTFTVRKE